MIRFSLIGCGKIAERHALEIQKIGKLEAVCDVLPQRADLLGSKYDAAVYYDEASFFSSNVQTDIIVICTPNSLHARHAITALNSGKHVICEKPMAISVKDAYNMAAAAAVSGKLLFIVKQNRFNPPVLAVKKLLNDGILGTLFHLQVNGFWNRNSDYYLNTWHAEKETDGGTLFTQFSHFVDLMYWLAGDVKDCKGYLANHQHKGIINYEDTGSFALTFDSGATGTFNYTVNSFGKNMEGSITLFAEKGTIKIGGEYLNNIEYQCINNFQMQPLESSNSANNYGSYQGSMSNHNKVYQNIKAVLLNKEKVIVEVAEAVKTVSIIEKMYQSAQFI